jgi:glucose-1-phosphate thymidylyltransferase
MECTISSFYLIKQEKLQTVSYKNYKGIILAGGSGNRLRPLTDFVCKQLLPVYDKPLVYYPLTSLILAGIKEVLIISTPKDTPVLKSALGDGSELGISIQYKVQEKPRGLADAFIVAEEFIDGHPVCMILGDNILHKSGFSEFMTDALKNNKGATIFSFPVQDPTRFGILEIDPESDKILSLEEKPENPKSNLAVIGVYIYDKTVVEKAKKLKPSERGELEITDLNRQYLKEGTLNFSKLSRGDIWMDVGVFDSFCDASLLIKLIESRLGLKIGSPEEASYMCGNIDEKDLRFFAKKYKDSPYGAYFAKLLDA